MDIVQAAVRAADHLADNVHRLSRPAEAELYQRRAEFVRQRLTRLRPVLVALDRPSARPPAQPSTPVRPRRRASSTRSTEAALVDWVMASTPAERSLDELATQFGLTRREREVAALIVSGSSNKDIAVRLVITRGTVANHVERVLTKLGCTSRSQVMLMALSHDPLQAGTATYFR